MKETALNFARTHQTQNLSDLQELLRIPSVSTLSVHQPDLQHAARWIVDYLASIGIANADIIETPGHPVVYGEWLGAGDAPTVLVYGHYDVQPVDPVDEWQTPPFAPTVRGEDIFCRGATDDKGQFFAVLAAAAAYLKSSGALPVNLKILLEGEEEVFSPNLAPFVEKHRDRLACDAILIADHPMIDAQTPMMMYAVRGNCYLELTVQGARADLHSGTFGGAIENPFNVLVRLLAACQDATTRRILIPGFYDRVREISGEERALINSGPANDGALMYLTGAPAVAGEAGYSSAERMSVRPTFEIHGMPGGFIEEGAKTVLPAVAQAKVSMRLVPDQDPAEIAGLVENYLRSLTPPTVTLAVKRLGLVQPAVIDYSAPAIRAAHHAYEEIYGRAPLYMRGGGSLPIVYDFQRLLGAPVVMVGMGLPDDNPHAPNEKLHLPNFYRGIETMIVYFSSLAVLNRG